jgi:hypothetical protein
MANKQPYYHKAEILFTATREVSETELAAALDKLKIAGLIKESIVVETLDAEPGDPHDL